MDIPSHNRPQKALLALLIPALMTNIAHADDNTEDKKPVVVLEEMVINLDDKSPEGVGETILNRREIDRQNIQNSYDLVRYNTEVSVTENGRAGNKGFAIRGVDGNRVNMNIDGVSLPESEANEVFSPYGYMYEGRFNPDIEMMNSVRIQTGADSLVSGSGAVGGSVSYKTKDPSDLISNGNWGGYVKSGYANKNEEWLNAMGLAFNNNKTEFLVNYAHREGHETKNHAMRKHDKAKLSPDYVFSEEEMPSDIHSLIYPNSLKYKRDSVNAKVYYHLNDNHRFGIHGLYQNQDYLINSDSQKIWGGRDSSDARRSHDKEELKNFGGSYRYTPIDSNWLDTLDIKYTDSKALGLADTWKYERESWNSPSGSPRILDSREYRPTNTKTQQATFELKTMPVYLGKVGEHSFGFYSNYIKKDYNISALYLSNNDSIQNYMTFAFPDAKKYNYNFTITDDIYFSERLKAALGVRYDHYKFTPYLQDNVDGFSEVERLKGVCKNFPSDTNRPDCVGVNSGSGKIFPDSKFSHITWSSSVDYQVIPDKLMARYKIGTGFLAPTATQIYSNFTGFGARQVPNFNLKPEKSLNQELELEWRPTDELTLTAGGYISKYDDFIHTRYWRGNPDDKVGCTRTGEICLQSLNLDDATVKGVKLGVNANLSKYLNLGGQLNVFANYHQATDKAMIQSDKNGKLQINTLAAVPTSVLLGADYTSANGDWQLSGRMNIIKRKKRNDTKMLQIGENTTRTFDCSPDVIAWFGNCPDYLKNWRTKSDWYEYVDGYEHSHLSKNVIIYDLYGTKKFGKNQNWILNAGVYNITDEKYIPWQNLRQLAITSVNSFVDREGHGFARYTAPGRNYAVSLTYEF